MNFMNEDLPWHERRRLARNTKNKRQVLNKILKDRGIPYRAEYRRNYYGKPGWYILDWTNQRLGQDFWGAVQLIDRGTLDFIRGERPCKRAIKSYIEFLKVYGIDPHMFGSMRGMSGGVWAGLLRHYGEPDPQVFVDAGFVVGRTFKVQHKCVVLLDKRYEYPFDLARFERHYKRIISGRTASAARPKQR